MKRSHIFTLGGVIVAAITSAYCYMHWHAIVLENKDTINLKAVELHSPQPAVRISGLSAHSALSVKNISIKREGSMIVVLVHLFLARKGTSGSFECDVPVPDSVNEIRFGKDKVVIWKREMRP